MLNSSTILNSRIVKVSVMALAVLLYMHVSVKAEEEINERTEIEVTLMLVQSQQNNLEKERINSIKSGLIPVLADGQKVNYTELTKPIVQGKLYLLFCQLALKERC